MREAPRSTVGSLLAAPLVAAVDSYVRRNNLIEMAFCEANGLSPKNLSDWRAGRRVRVQYAVADRTLVAMGLNWWDVWDENDPEVRQVWEGDMRAAA